MHWKHFYDIGSTRQNRTERIHQDVGVHRVGSGVRFWHADIDGVAAVHGCRWQGK